MDHPQAAGDRVGRRVEGHALAEQPHLAGIRRIEAVQHVHERRFARAVLAQQRVNFTRQQIEVDAGVGDHARKALDDAAHFDYGMARCIGHGLACSAHLDRLSKENEAKAKVEAEAQAHLVSALTLDLNLSLASASYFLASGTNSTLTLPDLMSAMACSAAFSASGGILLLSASLYFSCMASSAMP